MILAITYTLNSGEETPWFGESVEHIMEQLSKARWEDGDDYSFSDIKWFNLGSSFTVDRKTIYTVL